MKIFIPADYYLPAYKAGGPIKTVANIVSLLGEEIEFYIVTRNFDIDGNPSNFSNEWQQIGNASVRYLNQEELTIKKLAETLKSKKYDVLYCNSFFSLTFTVLPLILRRLGLIPKTPVIISPRGEFTTSALSIKKWKKRIYIGLAKSLGLFANTIWQASSEFEGQEIKKVIGEYANVIVANDLIMPLEKETINIVPKKKGELKLVFLSRISKMKNLIGALNILKEIDQGKITFTIHGPIEDPAYWEECEDIIKQLPANITAQYKGEVPSEQVCSVIGQHDLFFLPTFGEGFGHVIIEALSSGCPVLISDRTPWRNLEEDHVGWEFSLDQSKEFVKKIKYCVEMEHEDHTVLKKNARKYSFNLANDSKAINQHRLLFKEVTSKKQK